MHSRQNLNTSQFAGQEGKLPIDLARGKKAFPPHTCMYLPARVGHFWRAK
jgi:hypothetical protein